MSQQALREAFSEAELLAAKKKHQQVQDHMQQMDEVWRDVRWIMDALQYARYKQPTGGISISWIIDFSKEVLPDKFPSTSSQPDFMPSPMPSPEPCPKHSDFAGLSDEEGSSEVFLTTDSDYDSSRAQSPRELDLLPPSLCPAPRLWSPAASCVATGAARVDAWAVGEEALSETALQTSCRPLSSAGKGKGAEGWVWWCGEEEPQSCSIVTSFCPAGRSNCCTLQRRGRPSA
uniref:Uncharacterized protein n=1 Tax=Neogobius melanostomus TaxID=47308 RepID=A0A8C6SVE3_9GOBI